MNDTDQIGQEAARINLAFDQTRITFHNRAEALAALKDGGREIIAGEDDKLYVTYDGECIELSDALTRHAIDNRDLCDRRTLPRNGAVGRPGTASKADYTTAADKAKFIAENGIEQWEKLPLKPPVTGETLTKQSWYKLPRAEKVRRLAADPDAFNKLPAGDPTIKGALVNRSYTNREALAKQASIRPGSNKR